MASLAQQLVRLDTTNPPGREMPAIALLEERLKAAGFETRVVPYQEDRGHLVARLKGEGRCPGLLLSGHVDVVPTGELPWKTDPLGGEMIEGRIYGRGACDMKGGMAALVVAAEAIARSGKKPRGDLVLCATSDGENGFRGAEALAKEPLFGGLGGVLIGAPSSLDLYVAQKGALWIEATFRGQTAHAAMPDQGTNAVVAAVDFIARLRQNSPVAGPAHPVLGGATLNVGTIHGGVKTNVVPDRCCVSLDMRTVPGVAHETIGRRIQMTLNAVVGSHPGIQGSLKTALDREPVASSAHSPLALAGGQAVRQVMVKTTRPAGTPYLTDGCIWVPALNLPMVICGPGNRALAHQPNEYVEVLELEQAARIYTLVIEHLLFEEAG